MGFDGAVLLEAGAAIETTAKKLPYVTGYWSGVAGPTAASGRAPTRGIDGG